MGRIQVLRCLRKTSLRRLSASWRLIEPWNIPFLPNYFDPVHVGGLECAGKDEQAVNRLERWIRASRGGVVGGRNPFVLQRPKEPQHALLVGFRKPFQLGQDLLNRCCAHTCNLPVADNHRNARNHQLRRDQDQCASDQSERRGAAQVVQRLPGLAAPGGNCPAQPSHGGGRRPHRQGSQGGVVGRE